MPKKSYRISVEEVHFAYYDVSADSEEEAWDRYWNGDADYVDSEFSHLIEDTPEIECIYDPEEADPPEEPKEFTNFDEIVKKNLQKLGIFGGGDEEDIV
jgi:hypothetical protein